MTIPCHLNPIKRRYRIFSRFLWFLFTYSFTTEILKKILIKNYSSYAYKHTIRWEDTRIDTHWINFMVSWVLNFTWRSIAQYNKMQISTRTTLYLRVLFMRFWPFWQKFLRFCSRENVSKKQLNKFSALRVMK